MAPPKKPAGTTQPRGAPRRAPITLAVAPTAPADQSVPAAPNPVGGLLKASKSAWVTFWASLSAHATEEVDIVVAERWILALDEHHRALNAFRRRRLVEGSQGQPVLNPLATWVASREAAMHKAEQQLGIGTKNRADLAIGVGHARMTAAELNRMTEETRAGQDDDDDDDGDAAEAELLEEFAAAP